MKSEKSELKQLFKSGGNQQSCELPSKEHTVLASYKENVTEQSTEEYKNARNKSSSINTVFRQCYIILCINGGILIP